MFGISSLGWVHTIGSDQIRVFAGSGREDILDGTHAEAALAL